MQRVGIDPSPVHFFAFFLAVWGAAAHHRGACGGPASPHSGAGGGESIVEADYRFTVEEASERTVLKLRVASGGADAPASLGDEWRGR